MQSDGSGKIYSQGGLDLQKLAARHIDDGFTYCSGVIGVPISFLNKYCPEQFLLLGITQRNDDPYKLKRYAKSEYSNANDLNARGCIIVDGQPRSVYPRILIKRCICTV